MSVAVFIDGAVGTTGLDILDRLALRDDITLIVLDEARRKDVTARREALNDADIAILCLPDEAAREAVALIESDTRVIDASSAHRVAAGWTYGLSELGFDVAGAARVANPGCWATGFVLLVRPLVQAGLVPTDWPLIYSGASGYSGGGKAMIAEFEGGAADTAYRAYGLSLAHKHLPEMRDHAGLDRPPLFLPAVANAVRGMLAEVGLPLHALPGAPSLATVRETVTAAYAGSPLVNVADDDPATIRIEENAGSDRVTLRVLGHADQARLVATFDNLGKGAGGAAVQNLNLMAGFDPYAGLVL